VASFTVDLFSTMGIMIFAEFADKTNLVALSIMGKSKRPYLVAFGGLMGIAVVTMLGVIMGGIISNTIPLDFVPLFAGSIFVWIGLSELREDKTVKLHLEDETIELSNTFSVFKTSFSLIGFAEIGDKSQLFVIGRSIDGNLLAIFLGAVIGMGIIMLITAIFGEKLIEKLPEESIQKIANYGFIIAGGLLIISGIIGII
jgi:putative Ca2+/H+ antiporter (TMEM165/GDT1 family)